MAFPYPRGSQYRPQVIGFLLPAFLTFFALAPVIHSLPLTTGQQPDPNSAVLAPRQHIPSGDGLIAFEEQCGFDGDQDMYGLGIRIGYYVQWVATVFGAYYTPKIVSSAFEANAIFNIGMLAGLVYSTMRRGSDMYVIEPLMVLGFSIGGAIVGLLDPKNVHDPKSIKSLRARLVHLCGTGALSIPLLVYWTWYSFYGMDTMGYNHCATYTFFIVKINIWAPWFRYFMKIATIMSLVGLLSLGVGVLVAYRKKSEELPPDEHHRSYFNRPRLSRSATALAIRARPTKLQFGIVIFSCAICALSVELGIIWNHITGVNSLGATGQLIPMAIGIITSVRVFLGVINEHFQTRGERRKAAAQESFFSGPGESIVIQRSMRRSLRDLDDRDDEGDNKDEVLVRSLPLDAEIDENDGGSTLPLGPRPKISPSSTSDSQGTMISSARSVRSVRSYKSGKLRKEPKEKVILPSGENQDSILSLPTEPPTALTRGTAPSEISLGIGSRKKLQRDPSKRPG